ncbi:hypothetical protein IQ241_04905 [Romeria aff. gracilis LEGE 07310]|uniref:Uncharacterized protein n=1 Tax=Vasconcelosia minhoensis LEGE 07310 TaxID=915328 RepID=A0A8J7DKP2_9CYAN|nr:hypothetical protein [Romeria gracilis]MBE9076641.1 hypothetical protein [Romeria aff. gracilis LEGE 07310]
MSYKLPQLSEMAFDRVGHHNPQLLREWQGRLRWRNLLLTFSLSFGIQGLLLLKRLAQLPSSRLFINTQYCLQYDPHQGCQLGADQQPLIDWPLVWADVFRDLSFVLVWVLIIGGIFLLAADLSKENRRGTLNFLRMSPLRGRRILLGKLLGVPILLYLGIAAMLPLHLATGLMGSYPVGIVLAFYGVLGAIALCFYSAALWFALLAEGLQGFQTWLISGLSAGLLLLSWQLWHFNLSGDWFYLFNPLHILADWEVKGWGQQSAWPFIGSDLNGFRQLGWFFMPVGSHRGWVLAFALANALLLGLWFWVALERKFQTPANTALGKQQSYGLTLCLSLIIMGFETQHPFNLPSALDTVFSYRISMVIWAVLLMFLLLPSKQLLLDWARYRHHQPHRASQPTSRNPSRKQAQSSSRRQQSLIVDLLCHDGSPPAFALAINLGIIAGVFLLGIGLSALISPVTDPVDAVMAWGFCAAVLLICSLVVQWIALANLLHWRWLASGAVAAIIVGWPLVLSLTGIDPYRGAMGYLWLTTAFPQAVLDMANGSEIFLAIAAHLVLISGLSLGLGRRCQILGQSEWKALMDQGSRREYLRP